MIIYKCYSRVLSVLVPLQVLVSPNQPLIRYCGDAYISFFSSTGVSLLCTDPQPCCASRKDDSGKPVCHHLTVSLFTELFHCFLLNSGNYPVYEL